MIHRFGDCELDTGRYELRVKGEPQALERQVFRLLEILIENHDRTLTRDELIETVWEGRVVSDSTLASRIKSARQAIGDSGERQAFIQTVHGRGYRFTGLLTAESEVPLEPSAAPATFSTENVHFFNLFAASRDRVRRMNPFGMSRQYGFLLFLILIVVGAGIVVWRFLPSNPTARSTALVCLQALILGLTLQREPHFTR